MISGNFICQITMRMEEANFIGDGKLTFGKYKVNFSQT